MERLGCMLDHWLFSALDAPAREMAMGLVQRRRFAAGEVIFRQGDPSRWVLLVTGGRVRLVKSTEDGREVALGYLTPHDLYGEEMLFEIAPHPLSGIAVEDGSLCVCDKEEFQHWLRTQPELAMAVVRSLGEKLREVTELWASGAGAPVRDRITHILGQLARKYGEPTPQGLRIGFRITHEELSALVGASRVMVTYALGDLRKANLLGEDDAHHLILAPQLAAQEESTPDTPETACPCFEGQ